MIKIEKISIRQWKRNCLESIGNIFWHLKLNPLGWQVYSKDLVQFKPSQNERIFQSLWIGDSLSKIELISIRSFLDKGYEFHLYVYNDVQNIPKGVIVKDAREIVPEEEVFEPYGIFSNLFRYKLLFLRGGWWVDLDAVCLKPFDFRRYYVFGLQGHWPYLVCSGILYVNQKGDAVFKKLVEETERLVRNGEVMEWSSSGPTLVTKIVKKYNLFAYVLGKEVFLPVYWWDVQYLFRPNGILPRKSHSVHLYNQMISRSGIDKNGTFPKGSIVQQLEERYLKQGNQ